MRTTSSIQFYCRQSKANKNGLAPIEASIIINGKRAFINLPRRETPADFTRLTQAKRNNDLKDYLYEVRNKFNAVQTDMMRNNIPLTADGLKTYFQSGGVKPYTLEDLWKDFLHMTEQRIDRTITLVCYRKYVSAMGIMYRYVPKDTQLLSITPATIQTILVGLQSKYKEGTVSGIMTKIKTAIKFGMDNGRITINPFQGIKYGKGKPTIEYLTDAEIQTLINKHFEINRLEQVRDLALFQISSGMAYADTQALTPEDIHFDNQGNCYIYKERQKTGVPYTSVVFPEGVDILRKYNYHLPTISNQKMNSYLKEIQTICGIKKNLHTHLFRKTYGTRLLNRGVRLETVSRCLGHSSTQITQAAYAKLLKTTIIQEVSSIF